MDKIKFKKFVKEGVKNILLKEKKLSNKSKAKSTKSEEEEEVVDDVETGGGGDDSTQVNPLIETIQKALNIALKGAQKLGDQKLIKQVGNTLTFLTRMQINQGGNLMEFSRMQELAGVKEYGLEHDPTKVDDEDFDHPTLEKRKKEKLKEEYHGTEDMIDQIMDFAKNTSKDGLTELAMYLNINWKDDDFDETGGNIKLVKQIEKEIENYDIDNLEVLIDHIKEIEKQLNK